LFSRSIESNAQAADLEMQQHCQIQWDLFPAERVVFNQIHFPTIEVELPDHTEDYLDLQTRQSLAQSKYVGP
jgi:hypothetical protein